MPELSALCVLLGSIPSLRKFVELKRKLGQRDFVMVDFFLPPSIQFVGSLPREIEQTATVGLSIQLHSHSLEFMNGASTEPSLNSIHISINFWQFFFSKLPAFYRYRYCFQRFIWKRVESLLHRVDELTAQS